jgi:DeoR/GlpR family transcriptional regulator of sugar metabolism
MMLVYHKELEPMAGEARRDRIRQLVGAKGEVMLTELESAFPDCSSMTLRRDLLRLEEEGFVKRTRGGAVAVSRLSLSAEDLYSRRAGENTEAKLSIAQKAVALLESNRSLYFDSGSTLMCLAQIIPDDRFHILTSGPNIALELIKHPLLNVTLTGGHLNRTTVSTSGSMALGFVREVNIDIAFMASSGFTLETGFTSGTFTECELKREVVAKARRKVMLIDSSKIGRTMPFTFARLADFDVIVVDGSFPDAIRREAESLGVRVL